jgi:hypothetical protein
MTFGCSSPSSILAESSQNPSIFCGSLPKISGAWCFIPPFFLPFKLSQDPAHRILAIVFAQVMLTMITSRFRRTVSFFWYLKVFSQVLKTSPKDLHPQVAVALVGEKYNLDHVFHMDLMANLNATSHHPGPRGYRCCPDCTNHKIIPSTALVRTSLGT